MSCVTFAKSFDIFDKKLGERDFDHKKAHYQDIIQDPIEKLLFIENGVFKIEINPILKNFDQTKF